MTHDDILFWIAVVCAPVTVLSCLYQVVSYHWPRGADPMGAPPVKDLSVRTLWLNAGLAVVVCVAIGIGYWDRHYNNPPPIFVSDIIQSWGVPGIPPTGAPQYNMLVDTKLLRDAYGDNSKLMLVARVTWATVDRMTDTTIEKSGLYTISGEMVAIQHNSEGKLRFPKNDTGYVELNLALIPNGISPDQITSLADVLKVGGKIIGHPSQAVTGGTPPAPAAPTPASPPALH